MTGFGKIYELSGSDVNSYADLFSVSDSVDYVSNNYTSSYMSYYFRGEAVPLVYLSDDAGEREYVVAYGNALNVYTVDCGAHTITLSSSTSYTKNYGTPFMMYALKKVGSDYCIYYFVKSGGVGTASVDFRKITVTPGGGYVDSLIQSCTTADYGYVDNYCMLDRVLHLSLTAYSGVTKYIYIYTMDIDSESVSGGIIYTGEYSQWWGLTYPVVAFAYSNGSMGWMTSYVLQPSNYLTQCYIVINGTATLVYTDTSYNGGKTFGSVISTSQYNRRDSVTYVLFGEVTFGGMSSSLFEVAIKNAYSYTTITGGVMPSAAAFNSNAYYPAISHSYVDDNFYFVDTTTGQTTGVQFLPTGVLKVYDIYPKVDDNDGTIYANVKLNDNSYHTIGVDPTGSTIVHTFPATFTLDDYGVSTYYTRGTMNHGNFFTQWVKHETTSGSPPYMPIYTLVKLVITYLFGNSGSALLASVGIIMFTEQPV